MGETNLRDTLLVHTSEESGPGYSARILALKEEGFCLAILETEDLAVTTDIELALLNVQSVIVFSSCAFESCALSLRLSSMSRRGNCSWH